LSCSMAVSVSSSGQEIFSGCHSARCTNQRRQPPQRALSGLFRCEHHLHGVLCLFLRFGRRRHGQHQGCAKYC
jgi:hypothetical protein